MQLMGGSEQGMKHTTWGQTKKENHRCISDNKRWVFNADNPSNAYAFYRLGFHKYLAMVQFLVGRVDFQSYSNIYKILLSA